MALSAFVIAVPGAQALVGALRARFDESAALGAPPHITLLMPFMDPRDVTQAVLARAQRALDGVGAFDFTLSGVERFPATTYLVPEPAAPFVAMTRALVEAFPAFQPYGGEHPDVIPHLTVAHGDPAAAAQVAVELQGRLDAAGPLHAQCRSVLLLENASGRWRSMHVFAL
jgi:2'-5' RNA ligase